MDGGDGALLEEVRAVLAKKWALALLRDLGVRGRDRFGHFLADNPGLTPRVLCRRLDDLVARGLVARTGSGKAVRYRLTDAGRGLSPIVEAICAYASAPGGPAGPPAPAAAPELATLA